MDLQLAATLLDSLEIGVCVFDDEDRTVRWNDSFLRLFPEHDGHVYAGESYRENLRRFYQARLPDDELPRIELYIDSGVTRHRTQTRPYAFLHRGQWLRVASLPLTHHGRIRIWLPIPQPANEISPQVHSLLKATHDPQGHVLLETIADGFMLLDAQGRISNVNSRFLRMYGLLSRHHAVGSTYTEVLREIWQQAQPLQDGEDTPHIPLEQELILGAAFEVRLPGDRHMRVLLHRDVDGVCCGMHSDITPLKRHTDELARAERKAREGERQVQEVAAALREQQARLALSEERFRHTFLHSGIATGVTSPAGVFSDANPALHDWLRYPAHALIGSDLMRIVHADFRPALRDGCERLQSGACASLQLEAMFLRHDGAPVWAELSSTAMPGGEGQPHLLIHHFQDLTSRHEAERERDRLLAQLTHQASHDSLTGLMNRTAFEARVRTAMDTPPPRAGALPHALCFLDLDGFKQVNDRAGHAAGDALLRRIAEVLRQGVRGSDAVARVGGDEFALLLQHCAPETAIGLVTTLIRSLEDLRFAWRGMEFRISASAGVCPLEPSHGDLSALLQQADTACYAAKRSGGGRALAWEPGQAVPTAPALSS